MYKPSHLIVTLVLLAIPVLVSGQHVGIGTEDPAGMLDINGDVIFRSGNLVLTDTLITALDVNSAKFSRYRISGPDSHFAIAGISAGMDGRLLTLINDSDFAMELRHQDTVASGSNRIITGNAQSLFLSHMGTVALQYDTAAQRWIVTNTNDIPVGAGLWDTTGTNIYFQNFVGIGTEAPSAPLSIETAENEIGFSHKAVGDTVILGSMISPLSGSIGTMTNNVFSLQSGGQGKMHILPDGDVVIGSDSVVNNLQTTALARINDFDSKLSIFTPLSNTGWSHIGGADDMIVNEAIGQSSASLGTMTNHTFRLKTNGIGRLHVWYDGRVAIGANEDAPNSQFSVFTPPNGYGISHTTSDGIILGSHIGTFSASFGTRSSNDFRLVCNNNTAITMATTGNVGINTINPPRKLTVFTDPNTFGFSQISSGGIEIASHIGGVSASFGTRTNNKFRLVANDQPILTIHPNGNVGIGLGVNDEPGNKLEVNGTIRSKEIIVETVNWPDYVFTSGYPRLTLRELEAYILQHQHLPNIPSAREMEENGISVGETQKKMMEKIEELTLYILELQRQIDVLKAEAGR